MSAQPEAAVRPGSSGDLLPPALNAAFLAQAARFGHSAGPLLAGRTEVSTRSSPRSARGGAAAGHPRAAPAPAGGVLRATDRTAARHRPGRPRPVGSGSVRRRADRPVDEAGADRHFPFPAGPPACCVVRSPPVTAGTSVSAAPSSGWTTWTTCSSWSTSASWSSNRAHRSRSRATCWCSWCSGRRRRDRRARRPTSSISASAHTVLGRSAPQSDPGPRRRSRPARDAGADGRVARTTPTFVGPRLLQPPVEGASGGRRNRWRGRHRRPAGRERRAEQARRRPSRRHRARRRRGVGGRSCRCGPGPRRRSRRRRRPRWTGR